MRRSSSHPWPFPFHTHTKPFLFLLLVDGLSLCDGLLHLVDAVELFAQVSDALVSDPLLPSIDLEEAPPVFGGGRGRVGFVWV
jgi:hypothetical protein